ncbi:hypothetical protein CYMTET_8482 [Cymbomonas tetramitiformis]|uniref:Uncharacterized protein n=1 Tax=Cymbomonas tetramitiformis TaxID=36881 RepID=A0AAE0GT78_9CHLO|nr:hypothetical protein CYMTET_8482 [Cymbomonas tetramitiformis]
MESELLVPEETMNAYELEREARIARNREVMRRLGLIDADVEYAAAFKAAQGKTGTAPKAPSIRAPKRKREEVKPVRSSSRLANLPAQDFKLDASERPAAAAEASSRTKVSGVHIDEEKEFLLRYAGSQGREQIVGTASYAHTLHRVMTMSEAALRRRVTTIERACGKFAVTKMRLFARVLCLEGYQEVAEEATEALERLLEKLGEPAEEPPEIVE